ncbi:MAG: hypothetical protein IKV83_02725 [Muribaculaceae bacterium]|nr:hypothetical protein [Muribaculaceae bacterium]
MIIVLCTEANRQLDEIYENDNIYVGGRFTQEFINWNSVLHRYINENAISNQQLKSDGIISSKRRYSEKDKTYIRVLE